MIQSSEFEINEGLFKLLHIEEFLDKVERFLSLHDKYTLSLVNKEIREFILTVPMTFSWLNSNGARSLGSFNEWLGAGQEVYQEKVRQRGYRIYPLKFFATTAKVGKALMWPTYHLINGAIDFLWGEENNGCLAFVGNIFKLLLNSLTVPLNYGLYLYCLLSIRIGIQEIVSVFSRIDEGSAAAYFIEAIESLEPIVFGLPLLLYGVALLYVMCDKKVEEMIKKHEDNIDSLEKTFDLNLKM